jgi:hypothetical protein
VSDPTAPHGNSDRDNELPTESTPDVESEPIDVNELLESTRKLFEPEELQRAMEQAGYTPEPVTSVSENSDSHPEQSDNIAGIANQHAEQNDAPGDDDEVPPGDGDTVDEGTELDTAAEHAQLKGFNVLSVVALVLAIALSPLAVIFGYIALGQARRARQRGEIFALWAIGLGWVVLAAWVVLVASLVWIGYQQGITLDSLREFIELFRLP